MQNNQFDSYLFQTTYLKTKKIRYTKVGNSVFGEFENNRLKFDPK